MSGVYRFTEIEGKGLACIATTDIKKGSLILRENPQMPADAEAETMGSSKWIKSLSKSFNKMSKPDQLEYMRLKNKCSWIIEKNLDLKSKIGQVEKDSGKAEEIFQICCIYVSYRMNDGFRIKVSGIKHSCQPNAVQLHKTIRLYEVRAIANIKSGQEITINWCSDPFFGFKSKVHRQNSLLNAPPFVLCSCVLCEGDVDIDATAFEALIQEAEELASGWKSLENCRKEVQCYKKMYTVGRTQKIQPYFLYYKILKQAFKIAYYGYSMYQANDLKMEVKSLMEAMEKFGKVFGKDAMLDYRAITKFLYT